MGRVLALCATAAMGVMVVAGTCNAQKTKDKPAAPPAEPDVITLNGCIEKGSDGVFMLSKAQRESGAAGPSDMWVFDVSPLAAGTLNLDDRVGQRVQAIGRIDPPPDEDSKPAGKPGPPQLQVRSVKPIEGKPCS